jgi:hypothetical protein
MCLHVKGNKKITWKCSKIICQVYGNIFKCVRVFRLGT